MLDFRGLILLYCPTCDRISSVYSSEPKKKLVCRKCNTTIDLPEYGKGLTCKCECGRFIRAVTNCEKPMFEFECKCGYPNTVEYIKTKYRYGGIK